MTSITMKQVDSRIVALIASATLALSLVPAAAFAQPTAAPAASNNDLGFSLASTQQAADDASSGIKAASTDEGAAYVEGEILVTFKEDATPQQTVMSIQSVPDADESATIDALDMAALDSAEGEPIVVKLDEGADEQQAVKEAQAQPNVESAQLNYRYGLLEDPGQFKPVAISTNATSAPTNDPALASYDPKADENAWHLEAIDIESAWELAKCEGAVTVAVLDTGCDMAHEDLADNVLSDYAWNAYRGNKLDCDYYGHGTHVAGCVAAAANNELGTAGSSYNAKILPINVFDAYGADEWSSTTKALVDAYDYIFAFVDEHPEYNLHVINMSLGGYGTMSTNDLALHERIKQAMDRDIVSVCAGGNGVNGVPQTASHYPSDYDESFAVTALSTDGYHPTTWCDYNSAKDICTPGEDIYSTIPLYCKMEGNANWWAYSPVSGTSMATPITSGVFALLWAVRPDLSAEDAITVVKETASNRLQIADDWYQEGRTPALYGAGILSAGNAVAAAKKLPPSEKAISELSDAVAEAQELLASSRISKDGKDVPESQSWVSSSVSEALSSAIAKAKSATATGTSYDKLVAAEKALAAARSAFESTLKPGVMELATKEAKSALRHAARNALLDLESVTISVDGKGLAAGTQWVPKTIADALKAAAKKATDLATDDEAGKDAVAAAATALSQARTAFENGIKTAQATESSTKPSGSSSSSTSSAQTPAKKKAVVINVATVNAKKVKKALKAANNVNATKITLGAKVKKISAKAFKGTKVKTIVVKTKKLTKKSVKNSLKGSKVKTVKVNVGKAKANKTYVKKYKKLFVKKVAGKKATVKR